MKKVFLLLAFVIATLAVKAQDIIVLRNATEIQAKVKSIGNDDVTYLKWDNLEGPTYTLSKYEIFFIKYANGQKDTFEQQSIVAAPVKTVRVKKALNEDFAKAKFQGYSYLGADFTSGFGGPSLDFSFGVRTSKYFYLGAGVGWHNLLGTVYGYYENSYYDYGYYEYTIWTPYLTFTSDIKGYIPTRIKNFYPRIDLSFGGCVEAIDALTGFYMSVGAGFDYRRFSFGVGYQMPVIADYILPLGYVRLGIRFGK